MPNRAVFCDDADDFKPILAVFAKKKIYPGEEITYVSPKACRVILKSKLTDRLRTLASHIAATLRELLMTTTPRPMKKGTD